jgi:hypothetical protein
MTDSLVVLCYVSSQTLDLILIIAKIVHVSLRAVSSALVRASA